MKAVDHLRNNIIDKLLTISNKDYLFALNQIIDNNYVDNDIVNLSEEQILMLNMSEEDIINHRYLSQENLDKNDLEWLKSL
ncbi:MAG TPA: hypothetical protein VLZ75_04135 [Chitinophagales bacterium]|nr:hypothetical protein [Chitinophagales bacterium]